MPRWLLVLSLLGCSGSGGTPASGAAAAPSPVKVERAATAPIERVEEAVGVVTTLDSVELRPEAAGLVQSVHFADGDTVQKGTVLVRLRDADAQAGLADARARATLARLALDRARALSGRGDLAQADLDRATADDALARAAVARAEEAVRRTVITAPFAGVLGLRNVSPGQTVDSTKVLTRIEALDRLAVDLALPEAALLRVAVGQPAQVSLPALDLRLDARVSYVAPRVRDDTRTVEVRVGLDATDARLRPGLSAQVRIVTGAAAEAVQVASESLVPTGAGMSVWVVNGDTVALVPVVTGQRGVARVEIVSGVEPGAQVVTEGLARLRPGGKVEVTE